MVTSKKVVCILLSLFFFVIPLTTHSFYLPAKAASLDDSLRENPYNISMDEIEAYFSLNGLDYYAYMDINAAPDELVPVILEARSRIIHEASWVADDLNGWVLDPEGNVVEIVPKFHEIFPRDWEIPLVDDYLVA